MIKSSDVHQDCELNLQHASTGEPSAGESAVTNQL